VAGEWIKMRIDLRNDPTVFRLAKASKLDRLSVVGRLWALWAWADAHAVDGRVDDASAEDVDEICEKRGFAGALVAVGWLSIDPDGITIPGHEKHNGESAKERSMKNARQAKWRAGRSTPQSTEPSTKTPTNVDGALSTGAPTREEKRREDILTTAVDHSSIPACAHPPAGGETKPPDPSLLARIAVECARVKITGLTPDTIERWAGQGATPSLVGRAITEGAVSWARVGKGEMPLGSVQTTLDRILGDETKARANAAKRDAASRETIDEIKAAAKTAAPPPAGLIETQRKAARS
jgi:hypothetical protein